MRTIAMCLIAASLAAHAHAQCSSFQPAYPGLNGPVKALASWDPDGNSPRLVAGGSFTWDGIGSQDYIAYWDGAAWTNLGWGTDDAVNAITTWDPDGDGPLPAQLIIGGEFLNVGTDSTGLVEANHIARWDGQSWQSLDIGADGPVDALTTWDPDGDGPLPVELVAAGRFTHIGGVWTGGVAHWDGTAWHSFGWGIDGSAAALTVWDPDGDGPEIPNLVVGGYFLHAGASSTGQIDANNIARWDGHQWHALGDGTAGVGSLYSVVMGGHFGPNPVLVVGTNDDVKVTDGTGWQSLDLPLFNLVHGIRAFVWDAGADGPSPPQIFAAASWREVICQWTKGQPKIWVTVYINRLYRYDTSDSWGELDFNNDVPTAWTEFDPDGTGPLPTGVVLACENHLYHQSRYDGARLVDQPPDTASARLGGNLTLTFSATGATSYQWFNDIESLYDPGRNPLSDGIQSDGTVIAGSHTPTLTISHIGIGQSLRPYDPLYPLVAPYHAEAWNDCDGVSTQSVGVRLSSCSADFNHDGDVGTDADIEAFFACLAGSCCARCDYPDFNGDGDVGTDADIESFFSVLGGGSC